MKGNFMEDYNQLLELIAGLKRNRRSGFLGFAEDGLPRFAAMDETIGIMGGPRSNKTTSAIIPSVVTHPGPVIVTSTRPDVKEASYNARAAVAKKYGGGVYELKFSRQDTSVGPNVRSWSLLDGFTTLEECTDLAESFARTAFTHPREKHWADSVERLLTAYLYAAKACGHDFPTMVETIFKSLPDSRNLLLGPDVPDSIPNGPTLRDYALILKDIAEQRLPNAIALGEVQTFINGLDLSHVPWDYLNSVFTTRGTGTDERGSISSFTSRLLKPWHGMKVEPTENIDIRKFVDSHSTIYITIPDGDPTIIAPMVVAFIKCVGREWNKINAGRGHAIDTPLLLALDETANVCPIPHLDSLLSAGGGNGIQTMTVFHDPSQARDRWHSAADTILNTPNNKLLFKAVDDEEYLEKVSLMIGEDYVDGSTPMVVSGLMFERGDAPPARLISERQALDAYLAESQLRGGNYSEYRARATELLNARGDDGYRVRDEFYQKGDKSNHVDAFLNEINGTTTLVPFHDKRRRVEVSDLHAMPTGVAFLRSAGVKGFVELPRWFESSYWMDLFGRASGVEIHGDFNTPVRPAGLMHNPANVPMKEPTALPIIENTREGNDSDAVGQSRCAQPIIPTVGNIGDTGQPQARPRPGAQPRFDP